MMVDMGAGHKVSPSGGIPEVRRAPKSQILTASTHAWPCHGQRLLRLLGVFDPRCRRRLTCDKPRRSSKRWLGVSIQQWSSLLKSGLLHLVQQVGVWAGPQPAQTPTCSTKCNSPCMNIHQLHITSIILYNTKMHTKREKYGTVYNMPPISTNTHTAVEASTDCTLVCHRQRS